MADTKISALAALLNTEIAPTDLVPVVDVSAGASGSKQATLDVLFQSILSRVTNGVATKSASFSAAASEVVFLCDCTAGPITATLPTASSVGGKMYALKKIDTSTNAVDIVAATGFTDGNVTISLRAVQHSVIVVAMAAFNQWGVLAVAGGGGGWVPLTDAATIAPDARYGYDFEFFVLLGGNRVLNGPLNPTDGMIATFRLKQDTTGGRTITLATGAGHFVTPSDVTVTLSTVGSTTDFLTAVYLGGSVNRWVVLSLTKGAIGL